MAWILFAPFKLHSSYGSISFTSWRWQWFLGRHQGLSQDHHPRGRRAAAPWPQELGLPLTTQNAGAGDVPARAPNDRAAGLTGTPVRHQSIRESHLALLHSPKIRSICNVLSPLGSGTTRVTETVLTSQDIWMNCNHPSKKSVITIVCSCSYS